MKKKILVECVSSDARFAISNKNTLRIYSANEDYVYNENFNKATIFLTDIVIKIPKNYIGLVFTSQELLDKNISIKNNIKILESNTTTMLNIPLTSKDTQYINKHTHIATLYLIKQKNIRI